MSDKLSPIENSPAITASLSRELEKLSLIYRNHPTYNVDIFVSGKDGASDIEQLRQMNITTVVNCAVNLDFNYVTSPRLIVDHRGVDYGPGDIRYYKIGLVDGHGNPDTQMLAAHYILTAALEQTFPDKPSYPRRERGNILVNCRGGRSRSVVVVSLFLHISLPDEFPTLDTAIGFVRKQRNLHHDEWYKAPKPMLVETAAKAADWIRSIDDMRKSGAAGIEAG